LTKEQARSGVGEERKRIVHQGFRPLGLELHGLSMFVETAEMLVGRLMPFPRELILTVWQGGLGGRQVWLCEFALDGEANPL
jgi:hypothetical protein